MCARKHKTSLEKKKKKKKKKKKERKGEKRRRKKIWNGQKRTASFESTPRFSLLKQTASEGGAERSLAELCSSRGVLTKGGGEKESARID